MYSLSLKCSSASSNEPTKVRHFSFGESGESVIGFDFVKLYFACLRLGIGIYKLRKL